MCGIYMITNLKNNKIYIGKSSNIEKRWEYHKNNFYNSKEYNKPLYAAFRLYGLENFQFTIIESMSFEYYKKFSNNREEFWILYYNSSIQDYGYNLTSGGDGGYNEKALSKTRKLTIEEVEKIRDIYNDCHLCLSDAYEFYKEKISKRGFQAIWLGQNYKAIKPEVFSEENKKKHLLIERQRTGRLRRERKE